MRGDTLSEPKFVQGDRLQRFDVVLANPPYSIKQWDREAFASDPWGRNLYGTPPQGRADYAFWQHILCSLAPKTGRCAILFPHGVLFRQEEAEMRRKLIEADLIECVLGLGPNLFYNSPMEACVVICRHGKAQGAQRPNSLHQRRQRSHPRTRPELPHRRPHRAHRHSIRGVQRQPGFTRVVPLEEIRAKGGNLSIPLYVPLAAPSSISGERASVSDLPAALAGWLGSSVHVRASLGTFCGAGGNGGTIPSVNPDWAKFTLFNRKNWTRVPFGAFAESVNERVEPTNAAEEVYVGLDDLDSGSLHIRRWGKGSDVIGTKLRFRKGDIIFGRRRAYQRKLAVAEMDGICSAHAMVVRARPGVVLPEFLPFLMMSDRFMNRAVEISVGSLSPTINWTTLKLRAIRPPAARPAASHRRNPLGG